MYGFQPSPEESTDNYNVDDLTQSTTVVRSNQTFNASYGTAFDNGSGAQGIFVIDSFGIGGYELGGVQFAVVEKRTPNVDIGTATGLGIDTRGLLGVGPESSQAGVAQGITTRYPTIVSAMKDQGKIGSNAFSLYLNSLGKSHPFGSPFLTDFLSVRCCTLESSDFFLDCRRFLRDHSLRWCRLHKIQRLSCRTPDRGQSPRSASDSTILFCSTDSTNGTNPLWYFFHHTSQ